MLAAVVDEPGNLSSRLWCERRSYSGALLIDVVDLLGQIGDTLGELNVVLSELDHDGR